MATLEKNTNAFIVGASQGIGLGFVRQLLKDDRISRVFATYRCRESAIALLELEEEYSDRLFFLALDITEEMQVVAAIEKIRSQISQLHLIINCVGILHDENLKPEKSLRQIDADRLMRYFQVNSIGAILLAKHLMPLLKHDDRSVFATISAKIGSIGDNQLGGWYGYRASKAALNMLMKTASIEYGRTCPKAIVVTLHPGTTNTQLSRPFQGNVPPNQLFSIERTATQLLAVIDRLQNSDSGQFFSWDGSRLPW
jgi:NAD(P)-dependent dehydrogenase (short-subunit alcohol dehydrogenase family)